MPPILRPDDRSALVQNMDTARPNPAKASLDRVDSPSQSIAMTSVVKEALTAHYVKLENAARAMGNMDPSQLSRDLKSGAFKFERLDALDQDGKAAVTGALHAAFGQPTDPKACARRLIRSIRRDLEDLAEAVA